MLDQERNSPHKGGVLADDMGLGKTVQMIATMVINAPDLEETNRTTLIVVPAALLEQVCSLFAWNLLRSTVIVER
jgi:SNF2 family DNA or RNA helicase